MKVDGGRNVRLRETREPGNVIGMLVGDQDGVDAVRLLADRGQPLVSSLEAEAGIHQDARRSVAMQRGVAGTPARQHAELDDAVLP